MIYYIFTGFYYAVNKDVANDKMINYANEEQLHGLLCIFAPTITAKVPNGYDT
jgi:hypothetical protein